jgi:hypothetical protein
MSSTVTNFSNNINVTYPVPGVDNDTQGFRDNFANIKNALKAAAQELSNLNLNTSKLNTGTNDYSYGGTIYRAPLKSVGYTTSIDEEQSEDKNISFLTGNYQKISINGPITLTITDWPENLYSTIRFEIQNFTTGSSSINFDSDGYILKKEKSLTLPMILSTVTTDSHVFEVSTADGGDNMFVKFIGTYTNV